MAVFNLIDLKQDTLHYSYNPHFEPVPLRKEDLWTPPAEWLSLPDVTSSQKMAGIFAIFPDANFLAIKAAGDYTVDWGDGTITNHTADTVAYKEYTYSSIADTGELVLGYRQVIVQVYPQPGFVLSAIDLNQKHSTPGPNYVTPWKNIEINSSDLSSLLLNANWLERLRVHDNALTSVSYSSAALEYVEIDPKPTQTACNISIQNFRLKEMSVHALSNLQSLVLSNAFALMRAPINFNTLTSLRVSGEHVSYFPLYDTSALTNFNNLVNNCNYLTEIPKLESSGVGGMSNAFTSTGLKQAPPIDYTNSTPSGTFTSCFSLSGKVKISGARSVGACFDACYSVEEIEIIFDPAISPNYAASTGSNFCRDCHSLKKFTMDYPLGVTFNTNHFLNNYSLIDCSVPTYGVTTSSQQLSWLLTPLFKRFVPFRQRFGVQILSRRLSADALNELYTSLAVVNATRTISSAVGDGIYILYTTSTNHPYLVGQSVTMTGLSTAFIQSNKAIVDIPAPNQFRVVPLSPVTGSSATTGTASVASATVQVSGNPGTVSDNPSIATAKGWTVSG